MEFTGRIEFISHIEMVGEKAASETVPNHLG